LPEKRERERRERERRERKEVNFSLYFLQKSSIDNTHPFRIAILAHHFLFFSLPASHDWSSDLSSLLIGMGEADDVALMAPSTATGRRRKMRREMCVCVCVQQKEKKK
jgi:hypothetical protein